jgi:hypothetical protein
MRQIEKDLIKYLDKKLELNGLAQHALNTKDARLLLVEAAKACVGIREATGKNDGPMVRLFQETIGSASGESWCMSFTQSMIAYAEVKTGLVSPIFASEYCTHVWTKTPITQRVKKAPLPGAIAIWHKKDSTDGHTGIVLSYGEKTFYAVEGNTTSGLSANEEVIAEGGGVYYTKRNSKGSPTMILRGFLKPF